jgi:ring-1,2-phenylacetyl-CoA epoxidase subunit PaaA
MVSAASCALMFVDATVPQAQALGLTLPDDEIRLDEETGHYAFGDLDWDEFWDVVKGNGPCNHERLTHRVKAHEDGEWVRVAASAYAGKHAAVSA